MIQKFKLFWSQLPHQAQMAILAGASASVEAVAHVFEEGRIPTTLPAIKHTLFSALATGAAVAWAFYRTPNKHIAEPVPSLPPDVPNP